MTSFRDLLAVDSIDMGAIAAHLDTLDHQARVNELRSVPGSLQANLFRAARGYRQLTLEDFVPQSTPDRQFVRHLGKNSLPVFSHFEKRFARPASGSPVLWGFNHGPVMGLVGPGHFVMRTGPDDGELHVDYYSIPEEQLDGAPALQTNTVGISRFVYGWMIDVLRGVSTHVTIGRAVKHGKDTPNYFLLTREP
ncbi:MAG TPA: hypothetical protein DIU15_08345 [Deltaproteobacteria bacterium]|nr:hypothetical protein [Deltaproteobacteria bacterium]HCP46035.1 hypothetical protein [Deltaproteobacteria bacterium]